MMGERNNLSVAVLIPCFNEEVTIGKVIEDIQRELPQATIYVFDNNSTDKTAEIAAGRGTQVIKEKRQGKGFVIQSMFKKIVADIYVMVDGDDTYDLSCIKEIISVIEKDEADMVVGNRLKTFSGKAFRPLHTFGNKLVRNLINWLFKSNFKDIMSGLRVMNRDFVKSINITSSGFEVETEMTIKAAKQNYVIREMDISYRERPLGSFSKLNTISDGLLVLKTIFMIFRDYRPLLFFGGSSLIFFLIAALSGSVVIEEFIATRFITHVPLAIFASGSMVLSLIFFVTGIILDVANRRFDELYNFIRSKA